MVDASQRNCGPAECRIMGKKAVKRSGIRHNLHRASPKPHPAGHHPSGRGPAMFSSLINRGHTPPGFSVNSTDGNADRRPSLTIIRVEATKSAAPKKIFGARRGSGLLVGKRFHQQRSAYRRASPDPLRPGLKIDVGGVRTFSPMALLKDGNRGCGFARRVRGLPRSRNSAARRTGFRVRG